MSLTTHNFQEILKIGIQLTTEKDRNKLLNTIVEKGMQITNCEAGTLYLYEDNVLKFRMMKKVILHIVKSNNIS